MSPLPPATIQAVSSPGRTLTGGEKQILVGPHGEQAWGAQGLSAAAFGSGWKEALKVL